MKVHYWQDAALTPKVAKALTLFCNSVFVLLSYQLLKHCNGSQFFILSN